ncbi:WXG100 family type VII secretion target [Nocardia puris]|uniref:Type VII secretion system (Wss) protein ESAT-6 n=1 Tax=Nocardia puris TaxID=208602 RepID=A0A366DC96_9NOCA|nr:WXG100 family type VII secretion target [Nocardia puris]RBO86878.1 type VII secretion system (Wss) protein ESAT-6 [Nocardia puris]
MTQNEQTRITDGGENPRKYKHVDISAAFNPLQPGSGHDIASRYSALATQWEAGVGVFDSSIKKSISTAWEGEAATQSKDAIERYTKSAHEMTDPLRLLGTRVAAAAQAISETNNRLPEPVEEKHPLHKDSWPWVGTNRDSVIEDRQEEAQAVMSDYYVKPFLGLDGQIPVLPKPVDPTNPLDISTPTGANSDDPGGTPGSPGPGTPGPGTPGPGTGEDPATEEPEEEEQPDDETPDDTDDTSTDPASTDPSSTNPASTQPDQNRPTTPTVPSGTNPAGTPGSPGPGTPGSPGPGSTPSPGRSVQSLQGVPGSGSAGAASAATNRAMSGLGGMGMPGAGARGGKGDEESNRGVPDYLINQENTDELLGEIPKTIPGGVIGEHPSD